MAKVDLRIRLFARLLRLATGDLHDETRVLRGQSRTVRHNAVIDLILGAMSTAAQTQEITVAGAEGPLRARSYEPVGRGPELLPLVVNFHGGGFVSGGLEQGDWLCSNVAATVGAVVVSVDYRLAPTHRWPVAAEDSYAALLDIVARAAEFGADAGRLAVMGDSAGGNLAAVTTLMARDRSGPPISFQALLYPTVDLTGSSPSARHLSDTPVLNSEEMHLYAGYYLGGQDPRAPYASPLFAPDHSGLPPALLQVAEHDPLLDEGLAYAAALRAAGVPVRVTTYYGMPHGFLAFPKLSRSAPQALGEICDALREALPTPVTS